MIRRTQALAIRRIETKLDSESYSVIFTDEPGSSRSGPGITSEINLAFEHLYDRVPDIVAVSSDKRLLIVEVDSTFKPHLAEKYTEYELQSDVLIQKLSETYNSQIEGIEFGFGTSRERLPIISLNRSPFHKFYLPDVDTVVHEVD